MTRHRMMPLLAVPTLLLALALGACGEEPAGGGQGAAGDDFSKQLAFAKCMRENGVDMPDPEPAAGDGGAEAALSIPLDEDGAGEKGEMPAGVTQALETCRPLLPNGGEPKPMSTEELAKAREFAKCMRENGVPDYPDPNADGTHGGFEMPEADEPGFDDAAARFQKAIQACGLPGGAVPAAPAQ